MCKRTAVVAGVLFLVVVSVAFADSISETSARGALTQELLAAADAGVWLEAVAHDETAAIESAGDSLKLSGSAIPEEAPRQIPPEPKTGWLLGSGIGVLVILSSVLIRARSSSRFASLVLSADAPIAAEYARLWRFFHDPDDDYNRPYGL